MEVPMLRLVTYLQSLRHRNDEGQDLLEYALLVALIAIVAVGAVTMAGQKVDEIFKDIAGKI
jgi:Flp pilus assembly pilin Flp